MVEVFFIVYESVRRYERRMNAVPDIWRLRNKNFIIPFESGLLLIVLGHTTLTYTYKVIRTFA